MKVVHFYSKKGRAWVSPGDWWSVIQHGPDTLKIIKHGFMYGISDAILEAQKILRDMFRAGRTHAVGVALMGFGLAFFMEWPIIHLMLEIRRGIQALCLISGLIGLFNVFRHSLSLRAMKKYLPFPDDVQEGIASPPPPGAYREVKISKPKLNTSIFIVLLALVLNSVVFATYKTPAVVWAKEPYVVSDVSVTYPWVKWEQRPRIVEGLLISYFTMIGDAELWVVKAEYSVDFRDPYQDIEEADRWMGNVLNYFVDAISTQIQISVPANLEGDEVVEFMAINMSVPDVMQEIEKALNNWFSQKYSDAKLQWVKVTVEKIKVSEYQDYIRDRQ